MRRKILVGSVTAALAVGGSVGAGIALAQDGGDPISIAQDEPVEQTPASDFVVCLEDQGIAVPDFDGNFDIEFRDGELTVRVDGEEIDLDQAAADAADAFEACKDQLPEAPDLDEFLDGLPFELDGLPFDLDGLPFELDGLPFDTEDLDLFLDGLPGLEELGELDFGRFGPCEGRARVRDRLAQELSLEAEVIEQIDEILDDELGPLVGGLFGCDADQN